MSDAQKDAEELIARFDAVREEGMEHEQGFDFAHRMRDKLGDLLDLSRERALYADTAALALKNTVIANDALRAALQWYADADNYTMRPQPGENVWSPALRDRGEKARKALG